MDRGYSSYFAVECRANNLISDVALTFADGRWRKLTRSDRVSCIDVLSNYHHH